MYRGGIVVEETDGSQVMRPIEIRSLLIAGYTGRDERIIYDHIEELRQAGVAPPPSIPMVFPLRADNLTFADRILVHSAKTCGEVEVVLFLDDDEWLVGVGSDHTDRELEKTDIQQAKAACPKVISQCFWRLRDVESHWDSLILRSWITVSGNKQIYQDHSLSALLGSQDLLNKVRHMGYNDLRSTLIFCGTVPTLSGFIFGESMEIELTDPVGRRSIQHRYTVTMEEG